MWGDVELRGAFREEYMPEVCERNGGWSDIGVEISSLAAQMQRALNS